MTTGIVLWREVHEVAELMCKQFGLRRVRILPVVNPRARFAGDCDPDGKRVPIVRLRVHQLHRPSRPLARRTILRTLAHELAHVRIGPHGKPHAMLTREILRAMGG